MGRDGLYGMREVSFGISFSREGSLVPRKEIVKPLFCSIHTPSRQGFLYSCFYTTILPPESVAFALVKILLIVSIGESLCELVPSKTKEVLLGELKKIRYEDRNTQYAI